MAPTALLSVSNKEGLVPLAQGLLDAGYTLISSGGTATNAGSIDLGSATRTFTVESGSAAIGLSVSAQMISPGGALTKAGAAAIFPPGTVISEAAIGLMEKLNASFVQALKSPDVVKQLSDIGLEAVGNSSAEFAAKFRAEVARWSAVVKSAGIRAD